MNLVFKTHWDLARESVKRSRTRSFLTCLGIAVGVASIILILSLFGSIDNMISRQVEAVGADLIVVRPASHKDTVDQIIGGLTSSNQYLKSGLTMQDVDMISKLAGVEVVSPIAMNISTISTDERTVESATVVGVDPDLMQIQNLTLKNGMFLSPKIPNTAVVGRDLSLRLFGTSSEAVGRTFTMAEQKFLVVGLLEAVEDPINFNNVDFDNAMLVSANYLYEIDENVQIQQIDAKVTSTDILADRAEKITDVLKAERKGDTNFEVQYGDMITHPAESMIVVISGILTLTAGLSLLVGGIGVMNIMLVSVAERTREIGIRKAVGANGVNIMLQFYFEALILSLSGGMLGLILGYVFAFLVSVVTPFAPYISWQILAITLIVSLAIGTAFGIYPAAKAANKNPIESLRYYR